MFIYTGNNTQRHGTAAFIENYFDVTQPVRLDITNVTTERFRQI
jgi:hypothetical protein